MFKTKTADKAKAYLEKQYPGKDIEKVINQILEVIPSSTKDTYGVSNVVIAANYHRQVLSNHKTLHPSYVFGGGGCFKIKRDCIYGTKGEYFTYMPIVSSDPDSLGTGVIVKVGSQLTIDVDNDELYDAISRGDIHLPELRAGSGNKVLNTGKTELSKEMEKDFKWAAKYLRSLMSESGITTVEDFTLELEMLITKVPEELLEMYPNTKEGKVIAAAMYSKDNLEEVKEILSASKESQKPQKKESGLTLNTGVPVVFTRAHHGLMSKVVYLTVFDEESDTFAFIPVTGDIVNKKLWMALSGVMTAAVVVSIVTLPPVGAALAAAGSAIGAGVGTVTGAGAVATAAGTATAAGALTGTVAAAGSTALVTTGAVATGATGAGLVTVTSSVGLHAGRVAMAAMAGKAALGIHGAIDYFKEHAEAELAKDEYGIAKVVKPEIEGVVERSLPSICIATREAVTTMINDGILSTDENLAKKIRYI